MTIATTNSITLPDFYSLLESHDWFYGYSDDGRTYRQGQESETRIIELSKQSEAHQALYSAFSAHIHKGTEESPNCPANAIQTEIDAGYQTFLGDCGINHDEYTAVVFEAAFLAGAMAGLDRVNYIHRSMVGV